MESLTLYIIIPVCLSVFHKCEQCDWCVTVRCQDGITLSFEPLRLLFGNGKFQFVQKDSSVDSLTFYEIVDKKYPVRIVKYRSHYLSKQRKRLGLFCRRTVTIPPR